MEIKKVEPNSFYIPSLSFFLLRCILGTISVAKFGRGGGANIAQRGRSYIGQKSNRDRVFASTKK